MNRRYFVKISSILSLYGIAGCDKKKTMNDLYSNVTVPDFSSENLHKLLDKLLAAYEAKGMNVSASLLAPIEESDLKKKCSGWFPGELSPEIVSLYAWRGGQKEIAWGVDFPFWFRDNILCSIEIAEYEYKSMMESYGIYPENHELLKHSFPFASFNGGWYVFPTKGQPFSSNLKVPIISVFQDIAIYFFSIEKMVSTCIDWVRHEKYGSDNDSIPEDIEKDIWRKHNPGIFKNGT
jgi:hypothetical protein